MNEKANYVFSILAGIVIVPLLAVIFAIGLLEIAPARKDR